MSRLFAVLAFILIVADGSCIRDCSEAGSCVLRTTGIGGSVGPSGGTLTYSSSDCSTCGHSSGHFSWAITTLPPNAAGTVQFAMQASCSANASCCQAATASADVRAGVVNITGQNAKNLCGDDAPITWTVRVQNDSNVTLEQVNLEIECSTKKESTASPAAPSRIGGQP